MRKKIMLIVVLLVLLSACGPQGSTTTPLDVSAVQTSVVQTVFARATQTAFANIPITPTATPFPGIAVAFDKINLIIPLSVASRINGSIIPRVDAIDGGSWWEIAPEHIRLNFDGYILQAKRHQPQILIYPTNEYAGIAENITELNNIAQNPNQLFTAETLPVLLINARRELTSNIKVVSFQDGQGIRYITQVNQYCAPINNYELFYFFSGLTNDQKYYITAILPISAPGLPDNDPAGSSPIDITGLDRPQIDSALQEYYNNVTTILDNTQASAFTPSLDLLDALIGSVSIIEEK